MSEAKDKAFLMIANTLGLLSTCDRAAIGAVVTKEGRCVCWGYNGAPPGLPHCDENNHGWGEDPEQWHKDPQYAWGGI